MPAGDDVALPAAGIAPGLPAPRLVAASFASATSVAFVAPAAARALVPSGRTPATRLACAGSLRYRGAGRSMGRTFQRYLFRQILLPFSAGLALFTFVLLIARIMKLVELVVNRGVPVLEVLKVFSYILPAFLEVTVPMALLLACLMACGRLSADSEFVAMKACGLSLYQFARPFAVVAGFVWLLATFLAVYVRPLGNAGLKASIFELARTRASAGLKEHVFNDDFKGLVIYVDAIEPPGNELRRILISDRRDPDQHNTVIARRGLLVPDEDARTLDLRLFEGTIFTNAEGDPSFHKTDFGSYDVSLDLVEALGQLDRSAKDPSEMTLSELGERIVRLDATGAKSLKERVERMRRFSVPFAAIVFTLLAIPLGLQPVRAVRSRGLALSLGIILLYYVLLSAAETLATQGRAPVGIALWTPNVVLGLLGAVLFRRAARERPLGFESRFATLVATLRDRAAATGAA